MTRAERTADRSMSIIFETLVNGGVADFDVGGPYSYLGMRVFGVSGEMELNALPKRDHEIHIRVRERCYVIAGDAKAPAAAAECLRQFAAYLCEQADAVLAAETELLQRIAAREIIEAA